MQDASVINFGICKHCQNIRWHSNKAYAQFGIRCTHCGSPAWTPIPIRRWLIFFKYRLRMKDRAQLISWNIWEFVQHNHWLNLLNPYVALRLFIQGFFPPIILNEKFKEQNDASTPPVSS